LSIGIGENASYNTVTNNFVGGAFYIEMGGKGDDPGQNMFTHNTILVNEFSKTAFENGCGAEVSYVCMKATTLRDNLIYRPQTGRSELVVSPNFVSVQGERGDDRGRHALGFFRTFSGFFPLGPMTGSLQGGAICCSTPPCSWYTRDALAV
jgi:hypothetical protein